MIRWSKEQLLRPAKHLIHLRGSAGSGSACVCLNCGTSQPYKRDPQLCKPCWMKDPRGIETERIRRRKKRSKGYEVGPFDPRKPNCAFCVNYRGHTCAFGFPEAVASRLFAKDCSLFQPPPDVPPF